MSTMQEKGNFKPAPKTPSLKSKETSNEEAIEEPLDEVLPPPITSVLKPSSSNILQKVASRLSTTSTLEPPPDGGKAWIQCAMAWIVVFNTWGFCNSFGAFQTYYDTTLDLPSSTISWIGSFQVWILFFTSAFSGRALDAGLFLPTFIVGAVIQVIGIFMTSLSTKFWQLLLAQGVCTGIGGGIFFCPSMALVATYFSSHRGIAVALATTGNSAGGMIYPLIVTHLLPKIGFGWTVRVLGFINLVSLAVVIAFMRPRLPPRKAGPFLEWSAFKELPYALFVAGVFCFMWALYFTFYYIASYGRQVMGLPYADSVNLLVILNGIGIPARIASGHLADRYFGVLNTFIPLALINCLLVFCWIGVTNKGGLYVWTCIYGLFSAALQSIFPTTVASLTDDIRKTGTRMGMAFSTIAFAALTGPPIGGALLTGGDRGYMHAQVWAGCCGLVAAFLIAAARFSKYGLTKVKC